MQWKGPKSAQNSSILLKPTPNSELLVNEFNSATPKNNNDPENISSYKYYNIDKMHNVEIPTPKINLCYSSIHMHILKLSVGVIHRHPSMDLTDFNNSYLNKLLVNISKEQKSIFLFRYFNINLLNYNEHCLNNEFLDSLTSNSLIPLILQPASITSHSNTLIANIFSNIIDPDIMSGNLTATISDHQPQFATIPKWAIPKVPDVTLEG